MLRPHHLPNRQDTRRHHDARRRVEQPWRALYKTARWLAIRTAQLRSDPLCRMCAERGEVTAATVCDHVERHRGDPVRFFAGPFQSLCKRCHDRDKQRDETKG